jgi:hypothetical protein
VPCEIPQSSACNTFLPAGFPFDLLSDPTRV